MQKWVVFSFFRFWVCLKLGLGVDVNRTDAKCQKHCDKLSLIFDKPPILHDEWNESI